MLDNYYSNFSYYYDDLTKNVNYHERASYFNKIIQKFDGNTSGTLLDLACGTGNISEEMAKLGYDVIGADISEGMLNMALDKKFESFGFEVIKIDGHDFNQIESALEKAKTVKGKPTAILAKTIKGKGVSFMENQVSWHGTAPNKEQYEQATAELQAEIDRLEGNC